MAGYLPRGWRARRVRVAYGGLTRAHFDATLVSENEGGINIELVDPGEGPEVQGVRRVFLPWEAVQYVELLEEPDVRQGLRVIRKPAGW